MMVREQGKSSGNTCIIRKKGKNPNGSCPFLSKTIEKNDLIRQGRIPAQAYSQSSSNVP